MMSSSSSSNEQDARRVIDVLPKRLAKYGLTLHPEKTRLVDFRRPDRRDSASPDNGDARSRPGTFDLLGFTHYWAKSRKGYWVVKQKTAADRFRRALKRIADWCRRYRHEPVREQWTALKRKLLGHFGYFGITGNYQGASQLPIPCHRRVAKVAEPPLATGMDIVGGNDTGCWSGIRCRSRASAPPRSRSEAVGRRAGCGKSARPDPWEPRGVIPGATRPHPPGFNCAYHFWFVNPKLGLEF